MEHHSEWYISMENKAVAETMFNDYTFSLVKRGNDIEIFELFDDKISVGIVKNCNLSDTENEEYFDSQENMIWDFLRSLNKY